MQGAGQIFFPTDTNDGHFRFLGILLWHRQRGILRAGSSLLLGPARCQAPFLPAFHLATVMAALPRTTMLADLPLDLLLKVLGNLSMVERIRMLGVSREMDELALLLDGSEMLLTCSSLLRFIVPPLALGLLLRRSGPRLSALDVAAPCLKSMTQYELIESIEALQPIVQRRITVRGDGKIGAQARARLSAARSAHCFVTSPCPPDGSSVLFRIRRKKGWRPVYTLSLEMPGAPLRPDCSAADLGERVLLIAEKVAARSVAIRDCDLGCCVAQVRSSLLGAEHMILMGESAAEPAGMVTAPPRGSAFTAFLWVPAG